MRLRIRASLAAVVGVGVDATGMRFNSVVSPPLDEAGNSIRVQEASTYVSNALGGNPYAEGP